MHKDVNDELYALEIKKWAGVVMFATDLSGDLDANRPVPFRLTPNIAEFLTMTGVTGPLTASMVASARCLVQPQ